MLTRCAVLGSPIAHSLSPVLHRAAYAGLGLEEWTYDAVEVDEAALPGYVAGLGPEWRGLSLTMPLKRAVLPLLDAVSPTVRATGAANTVLIEDGRRTGENTDVPGAVAAVRERHPHDVRRAVVVGGGATAASMLLALADLGAEHVDLLVRDPARAADAVATARRRGAPTVTVGPLEGPTLDADLVVSTVPASAQTPALLARLVEVPVVFEVVYDGWPTPLARAAQEPTPDGSTARVLVSGLDLLVHQAVRQVALMTGRPAGECASALPAMRAAGERALADR